MTADATERRLAGVLYADVVGYSRLMAEDEDGTVRTLTAYRAQVGALVGEHRGRLADFSGDNFLAEFPTALDAMRCAIETQRVLAARNAGLPADRQLEFRMGVHLGDVRVEGERLYGEGVNVAARLEKLSDPGGISVSGAVREQVASKLALDFEDLGEQSFKNIPKPVHVYRARAAGEDIKAERAEGRRWLRTAAVGTLGLVLLGALGLWATWPRPLGLVLDLTGAGALPVDPPLPGKPSIVVLPFENLSGDPDQQYFVDGVTEELTLDLSQSAGLFVISRSSAFSYRGSPVKIADIARELGVRYVLEGSVRRSEERVRITAQLIDATQDVHIWGEQYDRELTDIFAIQSEVADEILSTLLSEVRDAEMERWERARTHDGRAYDAFIKGTYEFEKFRRASNVEARRWFARAIEQDPSFGEAHAMYGLTHVVEYIMAWSLDPQLLEIADTSTRRALELDPESASAWSMHANLAFTRGDFAEAIEGADRAIELMPNFDAFYLVRGYALVAQGRVLPALQSIGWALRLNPRGHPTALWVAAGVNYRAGRTAEALELAERARHANPDLIAPRVLLAAHYESLGRHYEAQTLVREILRVNPELKTDALAKIEGMAAFFDEESWDRLRRAGLP